MRRLLGTVKRCCEQGEWPKVARLARDYASRALELSPDLARMYQSLAVGLICAPRPNHRGEDYALARQWLLKALACPPPDRGGTISVFVDLAALACQMFDHQGHRKAVRGIQVRKAGDWAFHVALHKGLALLRGQRYRSAGVMLDVAMRLAQGHPGREQCAFVFTQENLLESGRVEEAERRLLGFKPLDAGHEGIRLALLADARSQTGRLEQALDDAVSAYVILSGVTSAVYALPGVYLHKVRLTLMRIYAEMGDVGRLAHVYEKIAADETVPDHIRGDAFALKCLHVKEGASSNAEKLEMVPVGGGGGLAH